MTPSSQEYAGLANDAYSDYRVGRHGPEEDDGVPPIDGQKYRVLEHVNNARTGYQGTIYQRVDGGDIVVAHRGTEQIWKDGVVADGSMVLARTNPQVEDALALTGRALQYAQQIGQRPGASTPEVTVTGHSLGGTLAQVSAHHFDLKGETFNAYGAASLDRKVPAGANDRVTNHVMATDVVSAASPHYGKVVTYATEKEISVLHQSGYFENRLLDAVTPDLAVVAAGRSLGTHSMHNFLPVDGKGRSDVSVLQDPAALERANEHRHMIENYRGDVLAVRQVITVAARGPVGWVRDGIDQLEGPLPAGAPAAAEAARRASQGGAVVAPASSTALADPFEQEAGHAVRGQAGTQQEHVARLLEAARGGDTTAMRNATQDLQQSQFGLAWQQRADAAAHAQGTHELAQQHAQQQQALAR